MCKEHSWFIKIYAKHLNLIKERSIGKIYVNFGNNNLDTHDKSSYIIIVKYQSPLVSQEGQVPRSSSMVYE